ncbi:glycosyltransferase family 2 protein [Micromonospora carbonacea]|jgi:GT2 family glycosyltransferase|uniref:Glycosyltransferase family 2 protein n=1 Tax=Micromonospora carbonacea TaxID=47853 RepID=A0A1C5ARN9_9ACTN|nr:MULTISPECIES: glycosyltransferase family 2 protein [Micromonospora]MBB5828516.1 GT2 family glycosyltransferase [Micromonospora carbonacea]MDG4817583.1 glycosyltransferase family 2 protein [Micromonospora sp. WMMD956]QLD23883.1 glycosyltransferase family 2 protein [Micromonospora carbonacea]WFE60152.1 glycosyltransferase family 2 protein [Micromonospora sp. WMMD712]SCF47850.1 Glycosyltransferase, GT2 family [Micromonospora carbonacea]
MAADGQRVSVVIPNYNYEKTLGACLDAVFAQTHRPYEVIVVDDGSTDRSRDIAARYPCRVVDGGGNRGVSAARNIGARAATGDILFFVDSDVALRADAIANALAVLAADPSCGCVHGTYDTQPLYDDGPIEHYKVLHAHWWRRRSVGRVNTAIFALAAVRRSAFLAAGQFHEELRDAEDVEYSERLARVTGIRLTDTVVGRHDDCARFGDMLREQYRRSLPLAAFAGAHRMRAGSVAVNPALGVLAAPLVLATLPLGLLHPALLAVPLACFGLFLLADPGLLPFVRRERGTAFLAWFVGVHLVAQLAIVVGAAAGLVARLRGTGSPRPLPLAAGR